MAYEVTTDTPTPSHHIRLTDGEEVIGLIFCNQDGTPNERAFAMSPYPRQALKTSQGESKYSDLEPPFFTKAQDDWSGGRAAEDFDKDSTKYYDGYRLDPTKDGLVLGGEETYAKGYRDLIQNMPASLSWKSLHVTGGGTYCRLIATLLNDGPSTAFVSTQCELWVRKVGTPPASLTVSLYNAAAGVPTTALATYSIASTAVTDVVSVLYAFPWVGATTTAATYFVVVNGGAATTPDDHWEVGVIAGNGYTAINDGAWTASTIDLAYRITGTSANFIARFFQYKSCLYYYTQPDDGGTSYLYRNGWRGAADSNAGNKDKLIDITQAWTADRLIGAKVILTRGPGSEEAQPWRTITDNDATTVTVAPDWNITHTTDTEYVIVNTDWWTQVTSLTSYCTGAAVANDFVYFALGEDLPLLRYQEYDSAGVWTTRTAADVINGRDVMSIRDSTEGDQLWVTRNEQDTYDVCVGRVKVPPKWGDLYTDLGTLVATNKPWDAQAITNVTQSTNNGATRISVAAGFTTGLAAVENLTAPVDITEGKRLGFLIRSSVACPLGGDLQLKYDEDLNLGQNYAPSSVKQFERDQRWQAVVMHYTGGAYAAAVPNIYDGDVATSSNLTILAADYLYISCDEIFNVIYFDLGGTVNSVASDASAQYYDGYQWTAVTGFNDTTDTAATKTLSGDGNMSFVTPTRWEQVTLNSVTGYMIRLKVSVNLTANVTFNEINVELKENFRTLDYTFDGDTATANTLTWTTEDYIYIISSAKFSRITADISTTYKNIVASTLTGALWNGGTWSAVTLTDGTVTTGATFNKTGDIVFTPTHDWAQITLDGVTGYAIRLAVSASLTAEIVVNQFSLQRKSNVTKNIPALTANEWQWVDVAISPQSYPPPNESAVQSLGIYVATDNGAQVIDIMGGIKIMRASAEFTRLPADARITGMEIYAGKVEDPVSNPWVFTENMVYELQTQNDNIIVPLPLRELAVMASTDNGLGHTTNGVYLWFNLGQHIEKYYNRTLDDVGPDRDAGLPSARQGTPYSMASLPGRIAVAIDANTGTSSVLFNTGTAWHEAYRAPRAGLRIRALGVQPIPGQQTARLWISQGNDVLWVPFSLNPYYDSGYRYTHEGYIITGWHYAGMQDVYKLWSELKLFMENSLLDNQYVVADYQLDDTSTWTQIDQFSDVPVEAIDIDAVMPRSRRIRFRLRMYTTDHAQTPRIRAMTLEGVGFVPVKYQFALTFVVDSKLQDLNGKLEEKSMEDLIDTLKTWANEGHELQVEDVHGLFRDDRSYFIDPPSFSPLRRIPATQYGRHIGKLVIVEA